MSLFKILILILAGLLIRVLFPGEKRKWALLVISIVMIFWLQPALPIRNMDFWFPVATLGVICLTWALSSGSEQLLLRSNWLAAGLTLLTVLSIGLTRFISLEGLVTATRPPQFHLVLLVLLGFTLITYLLVRFTPPSETLIGMGMLLLLILFLILKTPLLSYYASLGLRNLMGQDLALTQSTDLGWLGFSYVAFRLIHTLLDKINGRLDHIELGEYLVYTIFFPAFMAGPLDRLQRFRKDLNSPQPLHSGELLQSGERLAIGLFRKFILADALALIALSGTNAQQVQTSGWLWVMLIAYAFQIFFDFAGYTDIAIGTGMLLGFQLPENFNQPYRKPNLALFWNSWHMTLTQWVRSYLFFPLTRALRKEDKLSAPLIIFITQMLTMLVIGLWHGVTRNFLIWGAWHGIGLFVHNRWSAFAGPKVAELTQNRPTLTGIFKVSSILLTFLFVSLGWVWFALPTTSLALATFAKLFGIGS